MATGAASASATTTLVARGQGRSLPTSMDGTAAVRPFLNTGICPPGWSCADIGSPPIAGSQTISADVWAVMGSGADIAGASDQFHFVWQPLAGNGSVSARVTGQTGTGTFAKAGVMIRADTTAGAPFYDAVVEPRGGTNLQVQYRPTAGATVVAVTDVAGPLPAYVRVTRVGDTFTAYTSTDGLAWVAVPGTAITFAAGALPRPALAGLAVDSFNVSQASTATFDSVVVGNPLSWNPTITSVPASLEFAATAVGQNGDIYLLGGWDGTAASAATYIYNPRTNGWSQGAPLPAPRSGAQAITLPDGTIAVLGGATGCGDSLPCASGATVYTSVAVYSPTLDRWNPAGGPVIPAMPTARQGFAAVLLHGRIYAIGGATSSAPLASSDVYDVASNTWLSGAAVPPVLPQALLGLSAVVDGLGQIAVMGGFDGTNPPSHSLYLYTPGATAWADGASLPQYTRDAAATVGVDGQVYLVGGFNGGQYLPMTQVYSPTRDAWSYGAPPAAALLGRSAVTLPSGPLVALGGRSWETITNDVDIYGPTLAATPDGGAPGATTTLTGQGFTPGGVVAVAWGGVGGALPATATADTLGAVTLTLTVPPIVTQGENTLTAQDLSASYAVTTSYAGSGLVWTASLAAMPAFRERPAVAVGRDGNIYAFGGDVNLVTQNSAYRYHPATDAWTLAATLPYTVEGAQAVALPDGRLAVLGGSTGCYFSNACGVYNRVSVYDPATDTWSTTAIPALRTPRYRFAAVVAGAQIYAIGGWTGGGNTNAVEMYDLSNPSAGWQAVAILPVALEAEGAAVGPDGRIYVAGGLTGGPDGRGGSIVNTLYVYDPQHPQAGWSEGPRLPWPTEDVAVTQFNATLGPGGKVYVLGGWDGIPGRFDLHSGGTSAVTAFDPRTLTWARTTSLPNTINGSQAVATPNGQLFVVGNGQVIIGTITEALGGAIPWHRRQSVRFSDSLSAQVDLADGHIDVSASDLAIPARGPALSLSHVWDSQRAHNGDATTAGQGWSSSLTPAMGGVLTQTVSFTDSAGTRWLFPYDGSTSGNGPFSQYDIPPGQPWGLSTSPITGYTLSNILTGEVMVFDAQGRLQTDTDAYGNQNSLTAGTNTPTTETNSNVNDHTMGRSLAFTYNAQGLLADAQSPLWQQGGAGQAGSQHVTYGYNASNQLTTLTRGAGTSDALTDTFGYQGQQLITVTTPYTQTTRTWTLGYDPQGRVTSITSPISGQLGQAGYTPSDTTQFTYGVSQTMAIEGYGSSQPLTHTYTLDAQGNAPQLTDVSGQGHVRTAAYDIDHDVISGTDALGNTTLYTYTYAGPTGSVGLLTQEQQPAISANTLDNGLTPVTTTYAYDPVTYDRLREDKPNGGEIYYTYDGHHAIATTVELTGYSSCTNALVSRAAITPNGVCQRTPLYRGSVTQYDHYGEVTGTTDGRGVDITATTGQTPTASLDPQLGPLYTSHSAYDAQGDQTASGTPPITTTLPSGQPQPATPVTTTTGYDGDGNPITTTSANGNTSMTGYDHLGRVIQTIDPRVPLWDGSSASPTTFTRYDGNTIYTQDPNGAVTTSSYDPLGRLVATTNPVSGTQLLTYTATRQNAAQDEVGNITRYTYYSSGQLATVADPVSGTVQYNYDGDGRTIAITSGASGAPPTQLETEGYDALGHLITDTVGGVGVMTQTTRTAYDLDGNVTEVQHPDLNVTLNNYDMADEPVETDLARLGSGPFTVEDAYSYDAAGNQTDDTDANSVDHMQVYDAADRTLQSVDYTYGQTGTQTITATNGFDPDGNVVMQTIQEMAPSPQTHTDTFTYNADDWRTDATRDGERTSYRYDAAGQQRSQTVYDGSVPVTTQRDAEGRTTSIGESAQGTTPYTSTFGYNADDQPTTITVPGGVQELAQFDRGSRLAQVSATGPATATNPLNSGYSYGYDALGWTNAATATVNTINGGQPVVQTYTHDPLGRLTGVQGPSGSQSYGYDANDNLTAITTSAGTTTYAYSGTAPNATNELTSVSAPGQPITSYGYDGHGNTTSITDTAGATTGLSYDKQERLVGVTLSNGTRVAMAYNAQGQRASYVVTPQGQNTPSLSEAFTYREDDLGQAVVTGTGVTTPYTDTYLYGLNGAPLELLRQSADQSLHRYWYVLDGRGNVVALTDSGGNVVDRYGYDVWGAPIAAQTNETVAQPFRYASYWYDTQLGWYWVTLRSYNPTLGRWLQPDPGVEGGGRDYVYVSDDPIDEADGAGTGGLCDVPLFGGVACGVGSLAHGAYQLIAGDDIATLRSEKASGFDKFLAVVDLTSNLLVFVPIGGEGIEAAKLAVKAVVKVGSRVAEREVTYEGALELVKTVGRRSVRAAAEGCECFPADTLVATAHGSTVIATLHVGDQVLAEDPARGVVEPEPVEAVIQDGIKSLVAITISDGSVITATANHPFWVDASVGRKVGVGGWVAAGQLRSGNHLRTTSGQDVTVVGLRRHVGQAAVYTLTIAHDHTFFVGFARVLVHNCPVDIHNIPNPASDLQGFKAAVQKRIGDLYRTEGGFPGHLEQVRNQFYRLGTAINEAARSGDWERYNELKRAENELLNALRTSTTAAGQAGNRYAIQYGQRITSLVIP